LADLLSDLERIVRDGAALGINVIATGRQERAASGAWMSSVSDRLLFRLADPNAYLSFGLRHSEVPDLVPGRALDVDSKFELHVARAANGDLGAAIETLSCRADRAWARRPKLVRSLPTTVHLEQVISAGDLSADTWLVPVGLDAVRVEPMQITIRQADHLLVIGAGRSGRSSTLASLATTIKHHRADVPVAVLAPRGGPLELLDNSVWTTTNLDDVDRWVDRVLRNRVRRVVLLDDAERLPVAQMERLVTEADDLLTIIAATRPETPRSFQHWTRKLAASRLGVILRPTAGDGDALDVNLGHRLAPMPPGRAAIVEDGTAQIAQVALPW
jgi:S-DNA-T family DNA segregation ATPase FtsK/SpoIIIE